MADQAQHPGQHLVGGTKAYRTKALDVLLIYFSYTDLNELVDERRRVQTAFESKGLRVQAFGISMDNSTNKDLLKNQLEKFLSAKDSNKVLYYHGHGGIGNGELFFGSHNLPSNSKVLQGHVQTLLKALNGPMTWEAKAM